MEGIVTNLFQNFERTITDWFYFLTFPFKPLFANVKPNFITNLELLIYTMLDVPLFVLSLALFKLSLNCLMLDLFYEILGFVYVSMAININILPKNKI